MKTLAIFIIIPIAYFMIFTCALLYFSCQKLETSITISNVLSIGLLTILLFLVIYFVINEIQEIELLKKA